VLYSAGPGTSRFLGFTTGFIPKANFGTFPTFSSGLVGSRKSKSPKIWYLFGAGAFLFEEFSSRLSAVLKRIPLIGSTGISGLYVYGPTGTFPICSFNLNRCFSFSSVLLTILKDGIISKGSG